LKGLVPLKQLAILDNVGIGPIRRVNSPSTFRRYTYVHASSITYKLFRQDVVPARRASTNQDDEMHVEANQASTYVDRLILEKLAS
jgi:hypothetical protein